MIKMPLPRRAASSPEIGPIEKKLKRVTMIECIASPTPDDFVSYFPYACFVLSDQLKVRVEQEFTGESKMITKHRFTSSKHLSSATAVSVSGLVEKSLESEAPVAPDVLIKAVYNKSDNQLVKLTIGSQNHVPLTIFQVLNLIIQFHPSLTVISINKSVTQQMVGEIKMLLNKSYITDLCFDGSNMAEPNFHILLEGPNNLSHLSVARCNIDDESVMMLASELMISQYGSEKLMILNLTSNRIGDEGATALAKALRTNRKLIYLNLSGNVINDTGAVSILEILKNFQLTDEEIYDTKKQYISYLRRREVIIGNSFDKAKLLIEAEMKLPTKTSANAKINVRRTKSILNFIDKETIYARAKKMAIEEMGEFSNVFDNDNTYLDKKRNKFCFGNNTLSYINISYNNVTVTTLKEIMTVLQVQQSNHRKPLGLVNIKVEGNPFPPECWELEVIASLIESNLVEDSNNKMVMSRHFKKYDESKVKVGPNKKNTKKLINKKQIEE